VHLPDHQLAQCSGQPVQSSGPINSNLDAVHVPDHQTEIMQFDQCLGQPVQPSGPMYAMLNAVRVLAHDSEIPPYDQCLWQPVQSSGPINSNLDAVHLPDHQLAQCSGQRVQSSGPIYTNLDAVHVPDHQLAQCSGQPVQSSGPINTMLDAVARNNDDGTVSGSADDHSSVHKVSRKRFRNVPLWSRMKRKLARQHGQAYTTAGGKVVAAKNPAENHNLCGCKMKCSEKFTGDQCKQIFDAFYELSEDGKNSYIFKCIKPCAPKVRMCSARKHRSVSFQYEITLGSELKRVCKKAYVRLHQITKAKVAHIAGQVSSGLSAPRPVARGKHVSRRRRYPQTVLSKVVEHIGLFPVETSHYSRNSNPNRKYLSPVLNINKMYKLYRTWCQEQGLKQIVSGRKYRDIFNTQFNLGFGSPKSDTCSTCDSEDSISMEHKRRADKAFLAMKNDRIQAQTTDDVTFLTFDMQKTMPLPKLTTSVAFYLRQLWLYNVGIHVTNSKENKAYFHIWSENEAGRGCEEVGSCILTLLLSSNFKGKRLVAWSDSCAGQNKNFYLLCLWQYLIASKKFEEIHHKFPEPGHSFLDSDRDFAQVEKHLRKNQTVYSIDEYHSILAQSQSKQQPSVTRMGSLFVNVKELPSLLGLRSKLRNCDGDKVYFRDSVRWIRVVEFGMYQYKTSHSEDEQWKSVNIVSRPQDAVSSVQLSSRAEIKSVVKPSKIADIRKQLPYIPAVHRGFYEQIIATGGQSTEVCISDDGESGGESDETEDHHLPALSSQQSSCQNKVMLLPLHFNVSCSLARYCIVGLLLPAF